MKLPELLAPAGNPACAMAAFDAGADAVYCGLKHFNARERTENFTIDEMDRIIGFAHKNGKKVFVTLNTLIKESELPALGDALYELDRLHPDALIVQDLGALRAVKQYFPSLTVHASTQMGLHNSAGLNFARELGIKRVILERQTTLNELEAMMKQCPPDLETEIFIHGALCCCISGSCLLSSWLGGWSGNRGKCKQPCRRRYHSADGNGFFLSSQDLCTIELLPRIIRTGVASLKIEGRLRRPDYVHWTVQAYRFALGAAGESEEAFKEALPQAKEMLTHTCGRKWSYGFYTAESAKTLMKHDSLGASGLLCGKVLSVQKNGFIISAMRRIHLGDVIRVQPRTGDEGPAISVTKMSRDGEMIHTVRKNETCLIHSDKEVQPDAFVYKTGEAAADYTRRIAVLPLQKPGLSADISLSRTKIQVSVAGLTWEKDLCLEEAGKHPLAPDRVETDFKSTVFSSFLITSADVKIAENPFLPASVLKQLRLEFRDWLEPKLSAEFLDSDRNRRFALFRKEIASSVCRPHSGQADCMILPRGRRVPFDGRSVAREIEDVPAPGEELLLPFFIPETKLDEVRNTIRRYVSKGGKTVRITSVHHIALLKEFSDLTIRTCMPLPVCNSFAVKELAYLGVHDVQLWIELEKTELELLAQHSVLPVELYRYGRPVLLTTRAFIPAEGLLTDARGNNFYVQKSGWLTRITAGKAMSIPHVKGIDSCLYDYRYASPDERDTAQFNFEYGLQ